MKELQSNIGAFIMCNTRVNRFRGQCLMTTESSSRTAQKRHPTLTEAGATLAS